MTSFKFLTFVFIVVYVCVQLMSIIPQCSGAQTISVYKRNWKDSNTFVKGYKTENGTFEEFDVKVNPSDFWDRILLTHENDNILDAILKIAACFLLALYVYQLNYDNLFSKKSFTLFWLILFLYWLNFFTHSIGSDHTRDFFRNLYLAKGGDDSNQFDFQSGIVPRLIFHNWLFYSIIPLTLIQFYRTFKDHHEGKPEDSWD
jgi:hypothetical protein